MAWTQRLLSAVPRRAGTGLAGFSSLARATTTTTASATTSNAVTCNHNDTIFALSSGAEGVSGVAIIRVSGPSARHCLESITKKSAAFPKPRMATLRHLVSPSTQEVLDHAMVLWFPGPRSYTGEDVCELHVHGSRAVIKGVFATLTELGSKPNQQDSLPGIRLAERGEFTKRAFENGRLDLTEAEGLGDLLAADTSAQRKQALRQMEGHMRRTYESWRDELKSCLAHCEAVIDFGDDDRENDIDDSDMWVLTPRVEVLCREMKKHLDDNNRGEIIRDGVRVALVGPPNAGKSSLLNMLAKRPAAIVSPVAGTTRDVVEVRMDFNGVSCIVSDTAGITLNNNDNKPIEVNGQLVEDSVDNIFYSSDAIEFEGMRRAKDVYLSSHVRILICDASDKTSVDNTLALLNTLQAIQTPFEDLSNNDSNITTPDHLLKFIHKPCDGRSRDKLGKTIVIFNKTDLKFNETYSNEKIRFLTQDLNVPSSSISFLSCSTGEGLSGLEASLSSMINTLIGNDGGNGDESTGMSLGEGELITRTRHRQHVAQCVKHLEKFTNEDLLMDTAAEELRLAMRELGKLTGRVEVEDLLDVIFRDFCIGK